MKLNKRTIDALDVTGKDYFVWDTALQGFGIRLSPKGQKTFVIQYRFKGKTHRMKLGRTNLMTVEQARREARIILGRVESGDNPAQALSQNRKSPTLNEVSKRFIDEYVMVRLKPGTQGNYKCVLKTYVLPRLGTRKVADITHSEIMQLHHDLKHVPCQANRSVLVLSKVFNLCEQWGLRQNGSNPCRHVQKYKEGRRNRFLSKTELAHLWATLDACEKDNLASSYAINAYRLLILTGCRLNEIRTLKWSYIRGKHIELPDSKTGYRRIPLNDAALRILRGIIRQKDNEYVICGTKYGQPIVNLQKSWRRIRVIAGLDDLRIHDLRHTFASQAVMGGTPLAMVSRLLGHSKITTTMRYAHLADAELSKASNSIGELLSPTDS